MMKCETIEDLLPLYTEGICSAETKEIVESHLKECEKCKQKLELYRTDLFPGETDEKLDEKEQLAVNSMKKVKKKLSARKIAAVLLGGALCLVILVVGFLYYGECTGEVMNFTTIHNIFTIRKISSSLCKYDVEPLLEWTSSDDDVVCSKIGEATNNFWELSMDRQKEKVEEALQYYFKGEKIHYRIDSVDFLYSNNFFTGIPDSSYSENRMNPSAIITVEYYNKNASVKIYYYQKADRKYTYDDDINGLYEGVPTFDCWMEDNSLLMGMISAAVRSMAEESRSSARTVGMLIKYPKAYYEKNGVEALETNIVKQKAESLFEKGYNISEIFYQASRFDKERKVAIYKCIFTVKNQEGDTVMFTQEFAHSESNLYVVDDCTANLLMASDNVPAEIVDEVLNLFAP